MARRTGRAALVLAVALFGLPIVPAASAAAAPPPGCGQALLHRALPGSHALAALDGAELAQAARVAGEPAARLAGRLADDSTLWLDRCGRQFYVDPAEPAPVAAAADVAPAAPYPYDQTFALHSRPGSQRTIYLDFGGATISGTAWNGGTAPASFSAPAYDTDGSPSTFSNAERDVVQSVWQRVAEDYAPFDVDVTTQDPGAAAITRSGTGDLVYGTRLLVTNAKGPGFDCGCGGIAYVGVFDLPSSHDYYQPAFAFAPALGGAKAIAEAAAHEVGHTLGLSHDGTAAADYYLGQGAWAPIMGAGYYHPISQWSRGEYTGANNTQDDLAVIASHGAAYRADDHGDSAATATALDPADPVATGVIGRPTDTDWFSFTTAGGSTTVSVTPAPTGPDLDASLTIRTADGAAVATVDPPSSQTSADVAAGLGATYTGTLAAGTYYAVVDGVGHGNPATTGYSDYGSLGQYTVQVTTPTVTGGLAIPTTTLPAGVAGSAYQAPLVATGGAAPYVWDAASSQLPSWLTLSADGVLSGTPAAAGTSTLVVLVRDSGGAWVTRTLTLTVGSPVLVTTASLPDSTRGAFYASRLAAAGGIGAYAWSRVSGTIPRGLTLAATGLLSGRPATAGTYDFQVAVADSHGLRATRTLRLRVAARLRVTTAALPSGRRHRNFVVHLSSAGGTPVYRWAVADGRLPAGLTLTSHGTLRGIPRLRGTWTFTVRVADRWRATAFRAFTVLIR